jgi:hypothetical protein
MQTYVTMSATRPSCSPCRMQRPCKVKQIQGGAENSEKSKQDGILAFNKPKGCCWHAVGDPV